MNARFATTATLVLGFAVLLPARAADPQLLNLVMPDATVLAGVNVDQAKATPFGLYVLSQMQSPDQQMKELTTLTGFDPTRDVSELLLASDGVAGSKSGLFLARGTFDIARIAAAAATAGAASETYKGVNILEDPKKAQGMAFPNSNLVVAGDVASVKSAIDRLTVPSILPAPVAVKVNQWSLSQDAWAISTVPPSTLKPPSTAPSLPGVGNASQMAAFQSIQQAAGGVKFGTTVVATAQAQVDTAQNASSLGDVLKFLVNMAQLQAGQNTTAATLAKSLVITTQGTAVNLSMSLPADQFQQLLADKPTAHKTHRTVRKM